MLILLLFCLPFCLSQPCLSLFANFFYWPRPDDNCISWLMKLKLSGQSPKITNCPSKFYTPDHKKYRRPKITKQIKNNFRFFFYFFLLFSRIFWIVVQSQDTESIPSGETKENFNSVFFFFSFFFLPLFFEQTKKS